MTISSCQSHWGDLFPERQIMALGALCEVSRVLSNTIDEGKALRAVLLAVTHGRGLGFDRAFALLVDTGENWLEGRLAIGPSSSEETSSAWPGLQDVSQTLGEMLDSLDESGVIRGLRVNEIVRRFRIPISDEGDPLVKLMRSHEAGLASNGVFEPHGISAGSLPVLLETGAFAVAPIYLGDKDLGLLMADNAITQKAISLTDLKLLEIYALEASSAVQNSRLCRQLKERVLMCQKANQELREAQDHLLRLERLSTMGKLSALLAHEIRTPLVSIGGFARKMLRSAEPQDPRREEMEIIASEVTRLEKLVDEILGYGRMSKPQYGLTDINKLVRSVVLTMQEEFNKRSVQTVLNLDDALPSARADESQLRQALVNLVNNSVEAMPSGGLLTIATNFEEKFFEIEISDTGVGIDREHWSKLFSPFFSTKAAGTGLGLAVVSQVIDNHGGSLRFDSNPGRGTSFCIRLPFDGGRHAAHGRNGCSDGPQAVAGSETKSEAGEVPGFSPGDAAS